MKIIKAKYTKKNIFTVIFDRIMDGDYQPGSKITEQMLAVEFGVSRTPIREVLGQLSVLRLVKFIPNKGAEVLGLSCDDVEEMYEIRQVLELYALESAITNIRLQELSEIKAKVESLSKETSLEEIASIDHALHLYIVKCTGKPRLKQLMEELLLLIIRHSVFPEEERVEQLKREHLEIINALFLRDVNLSKRLLTSHLENSKNAALQHIFGNIR